MACILIVSIQNYDKRSDFSSRSYSLTTRTISYDSEVWPLQTQRLAILRQPLEGVVGLVMLQGKLGFRCKCVLGEDNRISSPEGEVSNDAVVV